MKHLVSFHHTTSTKPRKKEKLLQTQDQNILIETILDILVPLQTKTTRTVTKLKKEIECWELEFIASQNLCAPTVTDQKNHKTIAQKLKRIRIGIYLLDKYWKILKT